ncbi:MBL fold metallo-hydrolase [Thermodesulfatator atlanticus]|uniref:MBL fold metallo-hydrolase n=1 Tax=Thermodesulfatator atlanticus TaxID=501497 RepID=UPI0003B65FCA|nr:MBL fold metallo-hydrolase [Thermodesulfatator atlanticus]
MGSIIFCGACGTVTGSAYFLETGGKRILIDCGLYQEKDYEKINSNFLFDPKKIDYVILTHAHLDHSGRLLELVRDGFKGEILTTEPTVDLLEIVLADRLHLEPKLGPKSLVKKVLKLCWAFEYDQIFDIPGGIHFRLKDAGHILGAANVEIWCEGKKFVFSGDIGRPGTPIIRDPSPIKEADYIIMESTYGGRKHPPFSLAKKQLKAIIEKAREEHARIFIPSFAIGRTQELIYFLNDLVESGEIKPLPVIVDSPMALKVTKIYAKYTNLYDEEALARLAKGDQIFSFPLLFAAASVEASCRIEQIKPPYLIIAGSGMVTGGRIIEHLKRHLSSRRSYVVFVGYQAKGTPGREILLRKPRVFLDHMPVENRAKIFRIEAFSAHADHQELLSWLKNFEKEPKRVFLTHGEPGARSVLLKDIRQNLGFTVEAPRLGRKVTF